MPAVRVEVERAFKLIERIDIRTFVVSALDRTEVERAVVLVVTTVIDQNKFDDVGRRLHPRSLPYFGPKVHADLHGNVLPDPGSDRLIVIVLLRKA